MTALKEALPGIGPLVNRHSYSADTPSGLIRAEGAFREKSSCGPPPFVGALRFWGFDVSPPPGSKKRYSGLQLVKKPAKAILANDRIAEEKVSSVYPVFLCLDAAFNLDQNLKVSIYKGC